ncbi:MAG: protein-glutamate O-methyltransferase CheR [Pseudomonadales bacterium]
MMPDRTTVRVAADAYRDVCAFIYEQAGVVIGDDKLYLLDSRLKPVLRRFQLEGYADLAKALATGNGGQVHEAVVDALTTHETWFMRDPSLFDALRSEILPRMISEHAHDRSLTVWSAACSTGQEAYSTLIHVREYFPQLLPWNLRFICSDISPAMVDRTREGVYSSVEIGRGLPPSLVSRYFEPAGADWRVRRELRSMLEVKRFNLHGNWSTMPKCDVLFLRNVLIYFDQDARQRILARARAQLRSHGVLLLGASESTVGISDAFEACQCAGMRYFVAR